MSEIIVNTYVILRSSTHKLVLAYSYSRRGFEKKLDQLELEWRAYSPNPLQTGKYLAVLWSFAIGTDTDVNIFSNVVNESRNRKARDEL